MRLAVVAAVLRSPPRRGATPDAAVAPRRRYPGIHRESLDRSVDSRGHPSDPRRSDVRRDRGVRDRRKGQGHHDDRVTQQRMARRSRSTATRSRWQHYRAARPRDRRRRRRGRDTPTTRRTAVFHMPPRRRAHDRRRSIPPENVVTAADLPDGTEGVVSGRPLLVRDPWSRPVRLQRPDTHRVPARAAHRRSPSRRRQHAVARRRRRLAGRPRSA